MGRSQNITHDGESFVPTASWGISLTPAIMSKAKFSGNTSKYNISSNPQFGAEVLINYYSKISKTVCLVFGAGGSVLGYNFNYDIDKNMFSPPTGGNISASEAVARNMDIFYFKGQFEVQKSIWTHWNRAWILAGGGGILFSIQNPEEISHYIAYPDPSMDVNYLNRMQDNNNNGKPWFNLHFSGGHQWIFKKGNSAQLKLKINYSPISFVKGTYQFDVGDEPPLSGDYKVSGSFIGLEFSFILSSRRK